MSACGWACDHHRDVRRRGSRRPRRETRPRTPRREAGGGVSSDDDGGSGTGTGAGMPEDGGGMSAQALTPAVRALINAAIDSVAQLEILLLLRREPGRAWS